MYSDLRFELRPRLFNVNFMLEVQLSGPVRFIAVCSVIPNRSCRRLQLEGPALKLEAKSGGSK